MVVETVVCVVDVDIITIVAVDVTVAKPADVVVKVSVTVKSVTLGVNVVVLERVVDIGRGVTVLVYRDVVK